MLCRNLNTPEPRTKGDANLLLHIGGDTSIRLREVIAIVDVSAIDSSPHTRDFVALAKAEGRIEGVLDESVKSLVILGSKVYPSLISSATLARRAAAGEIVEEVIR